MRLSRNAKLFLIGFICGIALLALLLLIVPPTYFDTIEPAMNILLPRWWIFEANPITFVLCDLGMKDGLCYGSFDGGPLEWAEILWWFISPGILYGSLFLLIGNTKSIGQKIRASLGRKRT